MGRILLWVALGLAAYVLYRWWSVRQRRGRSASHRRDDGAAEPMVRCEVCGLNVPRSEALLLGERVFCCDEHRRRGAGGA